MKTIGILFVLSILLTTGIQAQKATNQTVKVPEITFKVTEHNFGTINQGTETAFTFEYKNTGGADLIIQNVSSSCGCTIPSWTKAPVKKKKSGTVVVRYDSNRLGAFNKTITIISNAKNSPVVLSIKGDVIKKE